MNNALAIPVERPPLCLTRAQVEAFHDEGYHFPLRALETSQAAELRTRLEAVEARRGPVMRTMLRTKPHLVLTWADALIRHPQIVNAAEDLLGPDLLVWGTSFFIKEPGERAYISWHQDSTYWGLSHPDVVTAWVALSVSNRASGAMRVLPGTHRVDQLPHRDTFAQDNLLTRGQEVQVEVDERRAVDIELAPGEFSLHHVRIVHGSEPNRGPDRRIGLAIRYIPTYLRQTEGERDYATLVRGVDRYHHFLEEPRPRVDLGEAELGAHRHITEEANRILFRGTGKAP